MRSVPRPFVLAGVLLLATVPDTGAAVVPEASPLQEKAFRHRDLAPRELQERLSSLHPATADRIQADLDALGLSPRSAFHDSRGGRFSSLVLSEPLVPGRGNSLAWPEGAASGGEAAWKALTWSGLTTYLRRHREQLQVDVAEIEAAPHIGVFEDGAFIAVHARRVVGGIPVRDGGLSATLNHGNLVLLGLRNWGDVPVPTPPAIGAGQARAVLAEHVRPFTVLGLLREPHLELLPTAPSGRYEYRLAWVITASVEGDLGTWEGLVDAHSGELLSFEDTNHYAARKVVGGVYPVSNDGRPSDGLEQAGWPMPYANVLADTASFADGGGNFTTCVAFPASTTLTGRFVRIVDTCGPVQASGAARHRPRHQRRHRLHGPAGHVGR